MKKFHYIVKAEINRFNDAEMEKDIEAYNTDTYKNEFSDKNPLIARDAAFKRAKSYEESFNDANCYKEDHFFHLKDGWYHEYEISVCFLEPETGKEMEIHNTRSIHDNVSLLGGEKTYDPFTIKRILFELQNEFEILKKNNISTANLKKLEVTFLPKNEMKIFNIFPTEIINSDKLTVTDVEL